MRVTLFVLESMAPPRRRRLFTLFDVDYLATQLAWVNLPLMTVVGVVVALVFEPTDRLAANVPIGIGYGALIIAASSCHALGHIVSSRIVNAPAAHVLLSATVSTMHYSDESTLASRVHIGRALGGPLLNLAVGSVAFGVYASVLGSHFLVLFGTVNLLFGAMTLSPIPSLDGAVFVRELRNWRKP